MQSRDAEGSKEGTKEAALNKALSQFNDEARAQLLRLLRAPGFSGHIRAAEVAALAASEHKTVEGLMVDLLPLARTYSRPPISNYLVGAIARGASGNLYLGANIEIPGHSLGFSVHGEQFALSNAYMHSEPGIAAIAVTAAPCGHCRQFMTEMAPNGDIQILIAGQSPILVCNSTRLSRADLNRHSNYRYFRKPAVPHSYCPIPGKFLKHQNDASMLYDNLINDYR